MKKCLILIVCITLFLSFTTCSASSVEQPTAFDHMVLSKYEGYSYDKFDRQWDLYGAFDKQYSDAYILIGIESFGSKTSVDGVYFYAWFRDADNLKKIRTIKELQFLADETLITIPMKSLDTYDFSVITKEYAQILKTISEAKELSIRICTEMYDYTFDSTDDNMLSLINAIKNIYDSNLVELAEDSRWTVSWKSWRYNNPIIVE